MADTATEIVFDDTMKKKKKKVSTTEEDVEKKKKSSSSKSKSTEDAGEGEVIKKKKSSSKSTEGEVDGEKKKKKSSSSKSTEGNEEADGEKKKKKKSSSSSKSTEEAGEGEVIKKKKSSSSRSKESTTETTADDEEQFSNIDLSKMKKKSSKSKESKEVKGDGESPTTTTTTTTTTRKPSPYHYEEVDTKKEEQEKVEEGEGEQEEIPEGGVTWAGTDRDYKYSELTYRIYHLIGSFELASDTKRQMKPPQVFRETTKKTVWANFAEICQTLNRKPDHVLSYVFAELGTNGSIDGNDRLIIRGRFNTSQIEIVIRHYISEYVACRNCKSPNTTLERNNRLYFLCCNACNSKRTVVVIKKGLELGKKQPKE